MRPDALSTATRGKSLYRFLLYPTGGFCRPGTMLRMTTGEAKDAPKLLEDAPRICSVTGVTVTPAAKLGPFVQVTNTLPPLPITGSEPWFRTPVRQFVSVRSGWSGWAIAGPR